MSIHGTCYDNGQAGNCGRECELFESGECEAYDDVYESLSLDEKLDLVLENI